MDDVSGFPPSVAGEISQWAKAILSARQPLPAYFKKPRHPWADRIALDEGLPPDVLKSKAGKALLKRLADVVGVRVVPPPSQSPNLERWAEQAKRERRPLPGNPGEPPTPCIKGIAQLAQVTEKTLLREPGRTVLADVVAAVGLEVKAPPLPAAFARWADALRAGEKQVPAHPRKPEEPWKSRIAELAGVDRGTVAEPHCAAVIDELVKSFGLAVEPWPERPRRAGTAAETKVERWAREAIAANLPLPSLPGDPDTPWRERIAEDAGMSSGQFWRPRSADLLKRVIDQVGLSETPGKERPPRKLDVFAAEMRERREALPRLPGVRRGYSPKLVAEKAGVSTALVEQNPGLLKQLEEDVGVETLYVPRAPGHVTLAQLRDEAVRHWGAEQAAKGVKEGTIAQDRSNMRSALKRAMEAHGGTPDSAAAEVLADWQEIGKGSSKRMQMLGIASQCLGRMERAHGLPEGYAEAVAIACDRKGISKWSLMIEIGLKGDADLADRPPTPARMHYVRRMEVVLDVPPGTFVDRIRRESRVRVMEPLRRYPEELRDNEHMRRKVRALLADEDFALPDDEFALLCRSVHAHLDAQRVRAWDPREFEYIVRDLPPQVEEEFQRLRAKKHKRWTDESEKIARERIGALVGYLAKDDQGRPDSPAGPAIPARAALAPEDITLALIVAVPEICERKVEWRTARIGVEASSWDVTMFATFRGWLIEDAGLFIEWKDLAQRLRPIPGLLSRQRIRHVQTHWEEECRRAAREMKRMAGDYAPYVEEGNDRQERVAPLLRLKNPLAPLNAMLTRMEAERARMVRGTKAWALATRDSFYVVVQLQNAFRLKTLHLLDAEDFEDLEFKIHRSTFKNFCPLLFLTGHSLDGRFDG